VPFIWNEAKASSNFRKHGASFQQAAEALLDPFVRTDDVEERSGEQRLTSTGMTTSWVLLRVTFSQSEDSIRIISARRATARERDRYEAG